MRIPGSLLLLLALSVLQIKAELPPLIDRNLFFGEVQISGAQISPDGQYLSFLKPYKGARNVWIKRTAEPFSAAKPLTAQEKRPIPAYFWSRDSKYILYVQDAAGDENFNIYAVHPGDPADSATGVPATRNLTDSKGVRAMIYALPKNQPDTVYIGLNDRDKAWHDLYKLTLSTGKRELMRENKDRISQWLFDNQGKLRAATRTTDAGDIEILRVDASATQPVYTCGVLDECRPLRFDAQNNKLYLITNKGPGTNFTELGLLDLASGKVNKIESDPKGQVDLQYAMFSERTDRLLATVYEYDRRSIMWHNQAFEADYKWLTGKLPNLELDFASGTADENLWIVSASSDTEPGEVYLFDRKAKQLQRQYQLRDEIPRDALASMTSIRYPSSDGLEIPAYLTLPKGIPPKDLPLIVLPHGGPWGRDSWRYDGMVQFLANRGYAVLQPNFRASVGFGKKFLDAGNGEWGRKMQDDLTYGVKYLVAQGTANPKRVGITGGSYGGYATLAGVAFTPNLYAAAVSIVGPSNLVTLLKAIPPYWEAMRKQMYTRMADLETPEGRKLLAEESPLSAADKIRTPLMVVQGANDPRVNKRESDQIVAAARDNHRPVVYLVAPDEGHGFRRPINNLAMFAEMERFLAKYLDGRAQTAIPENVETRIKEITVDPKTVEVSTTAKATQ